MVNGGAKEKGISKALVQKVCTVARSMGEQIGSAARPAFHNETKVLAVLVDDLASPDCCALTKACGQAAAALGYRVVYGSSGGDARYAGHLVTILAKGGVDGFLLAPLPGMEACIKKLKRQQIPVVFLDRCLPGFSFQTVLLNRTEGEEVAPTKTATAAISLLVTAIVAKKGSKGKGARIGWSNT
ncbi:MAG: LacI family transcriptional regulator [Chitinophagaceae bacterium]|nr:MAG: LacI family transcriptional regulator [Chitinophagaceae bacterium]